MEYRFIADKYIEPEIIYEKGGYYVNQVKGNVERAYVNSDSSTSLHSISRAYTRSFGNAINFHLYSKTGNTSGYWIHAVTKLMQNNSSRLFESFNSITSMDNIIVFTIPKVHFGDRLKSGTFNFTLNTGETFHSITSIHETYLGTSPPDNLYPYYIGNNEAIISSSAYSNSATFGNVRGKLFPYDGFGILWDKLNYSTTAENINFVNSITSVNWYTEILHTEMQLFAIKEPFELNYSRNPSVLKSLCSLTSGYSYGRDSLSGASSEFIDSITSLSTYVTTITYYNDLNECLVVSKFSKPIRLIKELPYSFRSIIDIAMK